MVAQDTFRRSPDRSGLTPDGGDRRELDATAHLACAAVGLFLMLGLVALTFELVVSVVRGLGVLSTTAVVLWFAVLWTVAWIATEVSLLRWGNRLPLGFAITNTENGDSRP